MFGVGDIVAFFHTAAELRYVEYEVERVDGDSLLIHRIDGTDISFRVTYTEHEADARGLVPVYDDTLTDINAQGRDTYRLGYIVQSYRVGFHIQRVWLMLKIANYLSMDVNKLTFTHFRDDELLVFVNASETVSAYLQKAKL